VTNYINYAILLTSQQSSYTNNHICISGNMAIHFCFWFVILWISVLTLLIFRKIHIFVVTTQNNSHSFRRGGVQYGKGGLWRLWLGRLTILLRMREWPFNYSLVLGKIGGWSLEFRILDDCSLESGYTTRWFPILNHRTKHGLDSEVGTAPIINLGTITILTGRGFTRRPSWNGGGSNTRSRPGSNNAETSIET